MSYRPTDPDGPKPPERIGDLRLFEEPVEGEMGRIVYQGRERPNFRRDHHTAHEYWLVDKLSPSEWRVSQMIATFERGEGYDRHVSELVAKVGDDRSGVEVIRQNKDRSVGPSVMKHFDDGSIRFSPGFTKGEADYRSPEDRDFDDSHSRCATCVHYISGEGCHFVRGRIEPRAYCGEFHADYGVFAHKSDDGVTTNAELVGADFDFTHRDIDEFLDDIEESLEGMARTPTSGEEVSDEEAEARRQFERDRRYTGGDIT